MDDRLSSCKESSDQSHSLSLANSTFSRAMAIGSLAGVLTCSDIVVCGLIYCRFGINALYSLWLNLFIQLNLHLWRGAMKGILITRVRSQLVEQLFDLDLASRFRVRIKTWPAREGS